MNKSDIVGEVAARTRLNRTDAAGAVDAVFEAVTEALVRIGDAFPAGAGKNRKHAHRRFLPPFRLRRCIDSRPPMQGSRHDGRADAA